MIESAGKWRLLKRMKQETFPMPATFTKKSKDDQLTIRCKSETKARLIELIPNSAARIDWINRVLEHGLDMIQGKKPT